MLDKSFTKKYGPWVVLIGAAEGIGKAYSIALAKRGMNIIMVDKAGDIQNDLAERIEREWKVHTIRIDIDLFTKDAVSIILKQVERVDCRLLIYNAAYSKVKPFIDLNEDEIDHFIKINAEVQIKLVHQFSIYLTAGKRGGAILLMSSLAGLIGVQLVSTYAATKALTWNLAEALHYDLKKENIEVMACLAGATITPTYKTTNPKYGLLKPKVMQAEEVAELALKNLGKKILYIPGFSNRLNYFILTRLLPRKWASYIANKTIYGMYMD
jgi:short-subunit dehydrogenase